jgi:hypothetical protein
MSSPSSKRTKTSNLSIRDLPPLPSELLPLISQFAGPAVIKNLAMTNRAALLQQHHLQLSKKEFKKAILYTICLHLDPSQQAKTHRDRSDEVKLHFTRGVRYFFVTLKVSAFGSTIKPSLIFQGGGYEPLQFEDGIQPDQNLRFKFKFDVNRNRNEIYTLLHWLLEKYFPFFDMTEGTRNDLAWFNYLYVKHAEEPKKTKKSPLHPCALVPFNDSIHYMQKCADLLMNP